MRLFPTALLLACMASHSSSRVRRHFHEDTLMTWPEARAFCRLHYAELSSIMTKRTNLNLAGIHVGLSWIGLWHKKEDGEYVWRWSDGRGVQSEQWEHPYPEAEAEACTALGTGGEWEALSCHTKLPFFCYDRVNQLAVVPEAKTWEEALRHCRADYTDLASLTSHGELRLAAKLGKDAQTVSLWTGLRFLAGNWFWVNNEFRKERITIPKTSCPVLPFRCKAWNTETSIWEDRDCGDRLSFLCYTK